MKTAGSMTKRKMESNCDTYGDIYRWGADILTKENINDGALDARLLLEFVCGTDKNTLLSHPERPLTEDERDAYEGYIKRRSNHEPLQYITGVAQFMGLEFKTGHSTLIPRFDTECLVEEVMKELQDGMNILDMCTGTGCILLSLLQYSNGCMGVGADINEKAIELAKENSRNLKLPAEFVESDLFENIEDEYDIIVSNPPYIESDVIKTLDKDVREFEPMSALDGGDDGLTFYRRISKEAKEHLVKGGLLFFEIGYNQGEAVKDILLADGYTDVAVSKDLAGLDRVVRATYL